MVCPNCGEKLEDGATACYACGTKLESQAGDVNSADSSAKPRVSIGVGSRKSRPRWLVLAAMALGLVVLLGTVALLLPGKDAGSADSGKPEASTTAEEATSAQEEAPEKPDETWTVLVYLCGTNLESQMGLATYNMDELKSLDVADRANIIVETGGCKRWNNDYVDARRIERYEFRDGEAELVGKAKSASMGSPNTLADFIAWGAKKYPADHYVLVFWDHGGGSLVGVCEDELFGDGLSLPEMRAALERADVHFDLVGFDTCLMATLETAQMLAPHADYMVASEEVIPAGGWAYSEWPSWFEGKSNDAQLLGKTICDSYLQKCAYSGVGDTATLSVVDLTAVDDVAQAFGAAAKGMASSTEDPIRMQTIVMNGRDAEFFGYASYLDGYTDMVDLQDLVTCMSESMPDEAKELSAAVRKAVTYELHGSSRSHATGLSVFYPLRMSESVYAAYKDVSLELGLDNADYLQYLSVRAGTYNAKEWKDRDVQDIDPVTADDVHVEYTALIDKDGKYRVQVTKGTEWITGATFTLGLLLDDGTVATLGSDNNLDLLLGKDVPQIDYIDRFEGGWLWIGDKCVHADIVEMVAENDVPSYNLYSVPVKLTTNRTASGKEITLSTNLLVRYDYRDNSYSVQCLYDDVDPSGMAAKSVASIEPGDKLTFVATRTVDGKEQKGNTGSIVWQDDTEVHMMYAGDGTYVYTVSLVDIFGKTYTPQGAYITLEGGKRTDVHLE